MGLNQTKYAEKYKKFKEDAKIVELKSPNGKVKSVVKYNGKIFKTKSLKEVFNLIKNEI